MWIGVTGIEPVLVPQLHYSPFFRQHYSATIFRQKVNIFRKSSAVKFSTSTAPFWLKIRHAQLGARCSPAGKYIFLKCLAKIDIAIVTATATLLRVERIKPVHCSVFFRAICYFHVCQCSMYKHTMLSSKWKIKLKFKFTFSL